MDREEALEQGYTCSCINCGTAYKELPTEDCEDGHGGRKLPMCPRCGCDLFADIKTEKQITT